MDLLSYVLLAFLLALQPVAVVAKTVVAHVVVGVTLSTHTKDTWYNDITLAHAAGIDGFALNIAPPFNGANGCATQISYAFGAANDFRDNTGTPFKMFFMFDYLGGNRAWTADEVVEILGGPYHDNGAMLTVNGQPLVSTFEGGDYAGDWPSIRSRAGGIHFVPDWEGSGGPSFIQSKLDVVDGAFGWDMWPDFPTKVEDLPDTLYKNVLGGKTYMMGVSPWFYTDLPEYNKHRVWPGDDLWHDRWIQAINLQPDILQIVTWNDFGESHYIGPIRENEVLPAARSYVQGMPHDAWRLLLPYYIAQYKNPGAAVATEQIVYWYRRTAASVPGKKGPYDDVTGNNCGNSQEKCFQDPADVLKDSVFFTAVLKEPATVVVRIGDGPETSFAASAAGAFHASLPFNGRTGAVVVRVVRNGQTVGGLQSQGEPILAAAVDGVKNYNAWVGGASA